MRIASKLRITLLLIISLPVLLATTCMVCADGVYTYVIEGRLFFDDGSPVDGIAVYLQSDHGISEYVTPFNGYFSQMIMGDMFGGCVAWPDRLDPPGPPPPIQEITFTVFTAEGRGETTVAVPEEKQSRVEGSTRWVLLGDVTLVVIPSVPVKDFCLAVKEPSEAVINPWQTAHGKPSDRRRSGTEGSPWAGSGTCGHPGRWR